MRGRPIANGRPSALPTRFFVSLWPTKLFSLVSAACEKGGFGEFIGIEDPSDAIWRLPVSDGLYRLRQASEV